MTALILEHLVFAIWVFAPAGISNMSPIFAAVIPGLRNLKTPIDFGRSFRGHRLLGANKTWRGLLTGTICGGLFCLFQFWLISTFQPTFPAAMSPYLEVNPFLFGAALGFGALAGDVIESFFKRQFNIPAGEAWIPFDQTDYIIGALVMMLLFFTPDILSVVAIFLLWAGLHFLFSYIGFRAGLKKKPV